MFASVFEAWWSTIWFENLLYDPKNLNLNEPVETFDWKDYVPDFLKGYLAPSPSFHKKEHFQPQQTVNHPKVETEHPLVNSIADVVVEPLEYEIPGRYNYSMYTLAVGALE